MLQFQEPKNKNNNNNLLSATRPNSDSLTNKNVENTGQYRFKSKQILEVYVDEQGNKYITKISYRSLKGNIRAIMTDSSNELMQITDSFLNSLVDIEVKLINMSKESKTEKQKIKIYKDDEGNQYIDFSSAYALNIVSIEELMNNKNDKYFVNENLMTFILSNYDIEYERILSEGKSR